MEAKCTISTLVKAVAVAMLIFLSFTIPTVGAQPERHWLNLITSVDHKFSVRAIAYDEAGKRIYMIFQTESDLPDTLHIVAFIEDKGEPYIPPKAGSPFIRISFKELGMPTCALVVGDNLYIGTDTGYVIVMNKNTYNLDSEVHVLRIVFEGEEWVQVRHIGYDPESDILVLGVDGSSGNSYVIITDRDMQKRTSIVIIPPRESINILWATLSKTYIYAYLKDSNDLLYILEYNLEEASSTSFLISKELRLNTSYRPGIGLDRSRGILYIAAPLIIDTDTTGTAIISFRLPLEPLKGLMLESEKTTLALVNVLPATNGKVYMAGTLATAESRHDVLFLEYNPDKDDITGGWRLSGELRDSLVDAHMFAIGNYIYLGVNTDSFSDSGAVSSLLILASPGLLDRDIYMWKERPKYSKPEEGLLVSSYILTPKYFPEPTATEFKIEESKPEFYSSYVRSEEDNIASLYLGLTESIPQPVPEPQILIIILLLTTTVIIILKHRGK